MILDIIIYGILIAVVVFLSIPIFSEWILFSFLYIEYSIGSTYHPDEYKPVSLGLYFKNYWREIWYVLAKYFFIPYKWINLSINGNQKNNTAILLIHGYYRNQADWLWMRKQLKACNCPIFTINLKPDLGTIQEITLNSLPPKIAKIQQQTECKNIILIGHSMGGIVASYYSEFLDHENLIKTIITLGTPLFGTKVAAGGAGENAKQMLPGSKFLADLREKISKSQQKYYQICSKFDNLIFPWRSALLDNNSNTQLILPFESHLGLLYSAEVATQLRAWVEKSRD